MRFNTMIVTIIYRRVLFFKGIYSFLNHLNCVSHYVKWLEIQALKDTPILKYNFLSVEYLEKTNKYYDLRLSVLMLFQSVANTY